MIVEVFPSGPVTTNALLIGCLKTGIGAFVDPASGSAKKLLQAAKNRFTIQAILLTHSHWDHFGDAAYLKQKENIPLYVHAADAPNLSDPGSDGVPLPIPIEKVFPDHLMQGTDSLHIGEIMLQVIHTPGHSPGSVCFYSQTHRILLSGDTLFKGSIGILSLPTADKQAMWQSLNKLSHLPPETRVYPGHGPITCLGDETWLPSAEEIFS